ncbi:helix-turn-helix domain-containing protein [Salmonirosea aquatica]|uniref:Helix-turn-helix domain-containing protein n=1 Tax=Salmonirosea aquatica TaxID=2654236 RepID=A0A7C9BDK5_9BACT|nr:helix-turn-helix domain-containing protein [Cytophagaceae bacterium SJW1-29]
MQQPIVSTQIQHLEADYIVSKFASLEQALQQISRTVKPSVPADEFLTQKEVAAFLKVSKVTVWAWSKPETGILTPHHIGNQVRYLKSEVISAAKSAGKGGMKP